jgi:hypothetical protein
MGIEAAIIGSAVAGGLASSRGASKAARAQQQAAATAQATEERMLERQLAETAPFRDLSLSQLNRLAALYGEGGEYARAPGMEEIQMRSAAARGGLLSGSMLKGTQRFGQELASQEYQNAFARARQQRADVTNALLGIGGFGPSLASSAAGAIGQTGSNIANLQMGAGQARASGYLGQANALSQALGQAGMGYGMYKGGYFGSPSSGLSNESLGAILPGVTVTGRRLASVAPSSFSGPR